MVKSGSEAASQLQGRIARAFASNSLLNTMDMTAAIQYIFTAAQLLGSQVYYKKSRMTNLSWLVYYSVKTSRHRQNELSYVPKKILTWIVRDARAGLKVTVGNKVKPDYNFTRIDFCSFLFLSARFLCSLAKACQHILDGHRGPKPG